MQILKYNFYHIYIDENLLNSSLIVNLCQKLNKRIVIVADSNLSGSYGKLLQNTLSQHGFSSEICEFEVQEQYKTRELKQQLEDWLLEKKYGRDTSLIALGGGIVTDLVGFLAATYCRGIPVIYLPTTLLAMVDASIGGKTGVNTPWGKNLIGTFTQPYAIGIDISTLKTLPDREWRNGIVEILKHSLLFDTSLFHTLQAIGSLTAFKTHTDLTGIIQRNCEIKQSIVTQDEHEYGIRQLLNFGHTIGHAIEILENYQITHGEAVAIGILVECYIAYLSCDLSKEVLNTVYKVLKQYELPLRTYVFADVEAFIMALCLDKKSIRSVPRFVLLKKIGEPYIESNCYTHEVNETNLRKALRWAAQMSQSNVHPVTLNPCD